MNNQYSDLKKTEYAGLSIKKTIITITSIIAFGAVIILVLSIFKPEAQKKPQKPNVVSVEVTTPKTQEYAIKLSSNGNIKAKTSSALIAQVSGEITSIKENFADGGSFKKDDILLTIDQRNYSAAVSNAKASLSQAQANFEAEEANAAQAKKDWERLGFSGEPNDRVLRKPQLTAAKAQLSAAKAALNMARLDYARTNIRAPYDGNVISRLVGLGEFVNTGQKLGDIFSNQGLEVALPINQEQYAQLDFSSPIPVTLFAELAGKTHKWDARLIRTAQAFDTTTRQIDDIAQINHDISDQGLKLKIGQYVKAEINARTVYEATIIPNSAIREGSYVFLLQEETLIRQPIQTIWQDDDFTIIEPFGKNAQVVTTSLSGVVSGTKAKLLSDTKTSRKPVTEKQDKTKKEEPENEIKKSGLNR